MLDVTASIVLYKNQPAPVRKTIQSFFSTQRSIKLFLVDNSPTDALRELCVRERCEYIFNGYNAGFGKAHNQVIAKVIGQTRYHLVLNPDVVFGAEVLDALIAYMDQHAD